MRDGLYKVHFRTPRGEGAGVVVLQSGRVLGGDAAMYYVGTYSEDGDRFTADIHARMHTKGPGFGSVFGVDDVVIHLSGLTTGDTGQLLGESPQAPGITFQAMFSLLDD